MTINRLIRLLAKTDTGDYVFNQYSYENDDNAIRRYNLRLYLNDMLEISPKILLVGEAAGYQGCRMTGIPFTSEYVLLHRLKSINALKSSGGFRRTEELDNLSKEPSATIVWDTISNGEPLPLLWNAFPFHPFKEDNIWSNRTPRKGELNAGIEFTEYINSMFRFEIILAVGRKAESALETIGLKHRYIRHPAQGGKGQFRKGLLRVVDKIQ
ncbi:MAG: uracil-DNA glycosylase [candidate division Zixibacteria bacterium]|nr:uracil-DNA glycosylase [candidate division Zixibacteria bacterium]